MYTGHLGAALAAKGLRPRVPLWVLAVAALAPDLLTVAMEFAGASPDTATLWTHSLPGALAVAVVFAGLYELIARDLRGAMFVGAAALSHVVLDLLTSKLPSWSGGPLIGLHLYRYDAVDFALEAGLVGLGWVLYRRSVPEERKGSWAAWAILVVLLACQLYFQSLPIS